MKLSILAISLILSSCGQEYYYGPPKSGLDGKVGLTGETGASGKNGVSLVSTTVEATPEQCPTGGYLVLISQDTLETGVWDPTDKPQTSFITCNGHSGAVGATGGQGSQGVQGNVGQTGLSGTNGTNSTPIVPVQFCKNFVPSYPNSFPEYGFVINSTVYGVYSSHGGFMAELPAGNYSSNGINASCNFTINPNGTITN